MRKPKKNLLEVWPLLVAADAEYSANNNLNDPPLGEWLAQKSKNKTWRQDLPQSPQAWPFMEHEKFKQLIESLRINTSDTWCNAMLKVLNKKDKQED